MKEIEKYMFLLEASLKYDLNFETVRAKVKPTRANEEQLKDMMERGIIRYFQSGPKGKKYWLVTEQAIKEWFPGI
ncbi:MAG TPA: hypothetical protein DEU03_10605 [Bacillus sp. (in: Bacteria)]|uniref:hypothetical protein n=1 Tax=Bacillus cereus TaxID=1396 RepID=UPI000BFCDD91|nr:hypothetical protein [Bacillus cereus]MED1639429.1 DNA-binding protein [Bacillus thuringiensis]PGY80805.1 hypothetical protein COE36_27415 [Bacillus cereus]HCF53584.1 hypothetical protein [Bacillus sp. (in: firmicutes)]